eukprot:SAG31_NODE_206_length_20335_cov_17.910160_12_plen_115_part_00
MGYFLVFVQILEKYGTLIEIYTALIEKVSAFIVSDALKNLVGVNAFADVYNAVRAKIESIRSERKRARKVANFLDPEAAARRKARKNEQKKTSRKRKVEEYKSARGQQKFGRVG